MGPLGSGQPAPIPLSRAITTMTDNPTTGRRQRLAIRRFGSLLGGRPAALVEFALAFRLLDYLLLAPLAAGTLRLLLNRWGRVSVGNFEIARFLISPPGLAAILAMGAVTLATLYLELAGLMRLMADRRLPWWRTMAGLGLRLPRLLELGLRQAAALLLLALPFLAAIAVVYGALWSRRDLYALIVRRPPVFWVGAGLAAAIVAAYLALAARLVLRWLFALPIVLFEPGTVAGQALRKSSDLTRGRLRWLVLALLAWAAVQFALSSLTLAGLLAVSDAALERVGGSLAVALPVTGALLVLHSAVVTALSVFGTLGLAALVLALYEHATGSAAGVPEPDLSSADPPRRSRVRWIAAGALVLAILSTSTSLLLLRDADVSDAVEITAHRAKSAGAPENTVAALRGAIEARADWAEIDVQHSADGALVIVHDTDLERIGGPRRAVAQSTLAEIQAIDVGRFHAPAFHGERVPTLQQMIAAAGDRIRLNIELKPSGPRDVEPLVRDVVAAVQAAGIIDRCRLCSQSYDGMLLARRLEPRLHVGFIAGAALGDLSRLDVGFLMVNLPLATRRLVDSAAVHGLDVHVWTVSDPGLLSVLIDRGLANVITDDPAAMRARLKEIRDLDPLERLLLRARNLLGD
jgi:glycerophosphoryl diester phosphodiesterase